MDRRSLTQSASRTSSGKRVLAVSRLGMLLALALILQLVEGMLPPLGPPGMKLGLANIVILLTLQLWGWRQALALVLLRQVLGGILTGKLFSVGFYLGLTGGLSAIVLMQLWLFAFRSDAGLVTTSIAGAIGHNWGQWAAARFLVNHQALIWYLPLLTVAALPCGLLVACLCRPLVYFFATRQVSLSGSLKSAVVLLFTVLAGIGFPLAAGFGAQPGEAAVAEVQVQGQVVATLDLHQEGRRQIRTGERVYLLEVRDGGVRILQADCPDQVCVRTGFIMRKGQSIVCVPGRLLITVDSPSPPEVDGYLP